MTALLLVAVYILSAGVIAGYMLRLWEEGAEYEDAFAVDFEDEHRALLASARWPYDYEADTDHDRHQGPTGDGGQARPNEPDTERNP